MNTTETEELQNLPPLVREIIELTELYQHLEPHAQRILMRIARRLTAGQKQYGALDLLKDRQGRDYIEEAVQEYADAAVYAAAEAERLKLLREST